MDPHSHFAKTYGHGVFYDELMSRFRAQEELLQTQFAKAVAAKDDKQRLSLSTEYTSLLQRKSLTLQLCVAVGDAYQKLAECHRALRNLAENGVNPQPAFASLASQLSLISLYLQQLQSIGATNASHS
jgi:hypothetical protein